MPFRLGYPLLETKIIMYKHVTPVKPGSPQLWTQPPYTNISSQLGRGVHNFGHKSPYTNISSQLGWVSTTLDINPRTRIYQASLAGVSATLDENPRTKQIRPVRLGYQQLWTKILVRSISGQLGWGVHNFGHKSPCKTYQAS